MSQTDILFLCCFDSVELNINYCAASNPECVCVCLCVSNFEDQHPFHLGDCLFPHHPNIYQEHNTRLSALLRDAYVKEPLVKLEQNTF